MAPLSFTPPPPGGITGLGYPHFQDEISTLQWESLVHPDDRARCRESLVQHLEGRTPLFRQEFRLCTPDQRLFWLIARGRIHVTVQHVAELLARGEREAARSLEEERDQLLAALTRLQLQVARPA